MPTIKYEIHRRLTFKFKCTHCGEQIDITNECKSLYSYIKHYYKVLKTADRHVRIHGEIKKDKFISKMKWIIANAIDAWLT